MAQEYRMESEKQDNLKIMEILEELPAYVTTYTNHIQFSTTPKTRLGYIRDIRTFLQYILDASGENFPSIKDIPASYLETVSLDFFNSYLVYISMYESENGQEYECFCPEEAFFFKKYVRIPFFKRYDFHKPGNEGSDTKSPEKRADTDG